MSEPETKSEAGDRGVPSRARGIVNGLVDGGVSIVASLPDSWLTPVIQEVLGRDELRHTRVSREDDAAAIAAGAGLMGVRSAVLCQNAGALVSTNMLAAFTNHHQLPFVMIAADRGGPEDGFYYQAYKEHVTADVMKSVGIPVHHLQSPEDDWLIARSCEQAWLHRRPVVLLCTKSFLLADPVMS